MTKSELLNRVTLDIVDLMCKFYDSEERYHDLALQKQFRSLYNRYTKSQWITILSNSVFIQLSSETSSISDPARSWWYNFEEMLQMSIKD